MKGRASWCGRGARSAAGSPSGRARHAGTCSPCGAAMTQPLVAVFSDRADARSMKGAACCEAVPDLREASAAQARTAQVSLSVPGSWNVPAVDNGGFSIQVPRPSITAAQTDAHRQQLLHLFLQERAVQQQRLLLAQGLLLWEVSVSCSPFIYHSPPRLPIQQMSASATSRQFAAP